MRLLFTAFLIFTGTFLYSQSFEVSSFFSDAPKNGKIEGVVLDNEFAHEPLAFATITVKNTDFETTSELDGSFSFNLKPGNYILQVEFLGYETVELLDVAVVAGTTFSITQKLKALTLNTNISMLN